MDNGQRIKGDKKSLIELFSLGELITEGKCTKTKKEHIHRYTHIYSSAKIVSA